MSLILGNETKSLTEIVTPFLYSMQRYWPAVLGPTLLVALIGLFITIRLPDYYAADAIIFIQQERLATKVVDSPEDKESKAMQIQFEGLLQEILSRPRLRGIINQYKLYPEIAGAGAEQKAILKLRSKVSISAVKSETGVVNPQAFQLSFSHSDPATAYAVTKTISNLFIEESLIAKKSEAQGTEEFLDSKLREARERLEQTEAKEQEFVKKNYGKLPEHLEASVARLQNMQSQLGTNSQLLAASQLRRSNLEQELSIARKGAETVVGKDNDLSSPEERLAQLKSALVVLKSQYSDKHPDVIRTKARIEALENKSPGEGKTSAKSATSFADNPGVTRARRELNDANIQIKMLEQENNRLRTDIASLEKDIQEMPLKEQELSKLRRDYQNNKMTYEKLLANKEQASLQGDLIRSQRAAQFRIVQPAEIPSFPAGPNRILIFCLSLVVAVLCFFSMPIALYFMNDSYKFKEQLEQEIGVTVIGIIPSIDTEEMRHDKQIILKWSTGISLLVFVVFVIIFQLSF
ncbi:MAG: hypothetical protein IT292_12535 [Deltaproteobacteria bacterium]|nr:hypothetical protein [Deltaproteobacteria bacterium]